MVVRDEDVASGAPARDLAADHPPRREGNHIEVGQRLVEAPYEFRVGVTQDEYDVPPVKLQAEVPQVLLIAYLEAVRDVVSEVRSLARRMVMGIKIADVVILAAIIVAILR